MTLRQPHRGRVAAIVLVLAATAGCASGSASATMQPCRGQPGADSVCPTQGTAHVVVTGSEERTFDAPLDTEGSPLSMISFSHGVIQLSYRDRSKQPTDSFSFFGARTTADAQQVGARVLIHGSAFSTESGCTVTLTASDAQRIYGTFACTSMAQMGFENSTWRIDATGSFSASP